MSSLVVPSPVDSPMERLRRKGNPFRQQFARNSDDAVCSLYDVAELFFDERQTIGELIDTHRGDPRLPTSVLTILGARGAGKTHLLHCLKHGQADAPRLFITPGTFRVDAQQDSSFLEYLLYQMINVLLSGGEQRGQRPAVFVGEAVVRRLLTAALSEVDDDRARSLLPSTIGRRWSRLVGVGSTMDRSKIEALVKQLETSDQPCEAILREARIDPVELEALVDAHLTRTERRDLKGAFRRRILLGFFRATVCRSEGELADFLTDGFADVPFVAPPTRSQLTLTLLQSLIEVIGGAGIPIAVAFDQLEELLYGRTEDEIRRSSDGFFGGIVQLMSQAPGLTVLLFAEEGLWNRLVPNLPPHILDRLHEPIHLPSRGLLRGIRLKTPTATQLARVVSRRVRRTLGTDVSVDHLPLEFPFSATFLEHLAAKETVLRLMLQGCCQRLDEMFSSMEAPGAERVDAPSLTPGATTSSTSENFEEQWHQEVRAARRRLAPVGSLAAAAGELQAGLARWLQRCQELGVEQDDWRIESVLDAVPVGDHPSHGLLSIVHWAKGAEIQRVGIGLWLGRGIAKPRDLETKLRVFESEPCPIDHLILVRPADDARLTGKTGQAWSAAVERHWSVRLELADLDDFAKLHSYPRWAHLLGEAQLPPSAMSKLAQFLANETGGILQRLSLPTREPGSQAA